MLLTPVYFFHPHLVQKGRLDQNSVEGWLRKFLSCTMPPCWSLERNKEQMS